MVAVRATAWAACPNVFFICMASLIHALGRYMQFNSNVKNKVIMPQCPLVMIYHIYTYTHI